MPRLVVVSNRVGIPDGGARAGGLEVAIRPALKRRGGVWFGWNGKISDDDPGPPKTTVQDNVSYVTIGMRRDDHEEFYNGFANRVLWPILHYRLDLAEFTRRDLGGYFRVNEYFATKPRERAAPGRRDLGARLSPDPARQGAARARPQEQDRLLHPHPVPAAGNPHRAAEP